MKLQRRYFLFGGAAALGSVDGKAVEAGEGGHGGDDPLAVGRHARMRAERVAVEAEHAEKGQGLEGHHNLSIVTLRTEAIKNESAEGI